MNLIKELFKPLQPSIYYSNPEGVSYEEVDPGDELKDYVYCYWRLRTTEKLAHTFLYRVISDGCIDILFEQSKMNDLFITGFSTRYLEYDLGTAFDYIGIRFLPTGFPALFDISAHHLVDQFVPLESTVPLLAERIKQRLTKVFDLSEASQAFNGLFQAVLEESKTANLVDKRLLDATNQILKARGGLSMKDLDLAVSERQLRRLFEFYFGESPKTFAMVVRFQNIMHAKPSMSSLKNDKIFYDEGYYDQAHFIKEFKQFYGVTPSQAFGR